MPIRSYEDTYRVIMEWLEEEHESLRTELESVRLTEVQTAVKRGRIVQIKRLSKVMEDHHV